MSHLQARWRYLLRSADTAFSGAQQRQPVGIGGRVHIPFVCGPYQQARQGRIQGQADLVLRDDIFYLLCTIDMPEDTPLDPQDVLGVDLGVVNLAKSF